MKLLYFSAPWCGPCKMFSPVMDRLASEGIRIEKINVDENQELSTKYNIRSVPTVVKVDGNGNKIDSFVGAKSSEYVKNFYKAR